VETASTERRLGRYGDAGGIGLAPDVPDTEVADVDTAEAEGREADVRGCRDADV
jgi:hypothetical protein